MAATHVRQLQVASADQAQIERLHLASLGYETVQEVVRPDEVRITMRRKKPLSIPLLVVCFLFWILPGLLYLWWRNAQPDEIVEITLREPEATEPLEEGPILQMSPDGRQWWDGSVWQDASRSVPPLALRSSDGTTWWDGAEWHSMPGVTGRLTPPTGVSD